MTTAADRRGGGISGSLADADRSPQDASGGQIQPLTGSTQRLSREHRRSRRRGASLALLLVLLGAAGSVFLATRSETRIDVVALARPVQRGQIIVASDLATVQISVDGGQVRVASPASAASDMVGKAALIDLPAGQLLSSELVAAATPLLDGTVTVGVRLTADALPAVSLRPGELVRVVRTDSTTGGAQGIVSEATVVSASALSAVDGGPDGDTIVYLAVPSASADAVAGAASVDGGIRLLGIRP